MKDKTKFTEKEIPLLLGCAAVMLLNISTIGSGGRRRAKEMVCLSNLRQWGSVFAMDAEASNVPVFVDSLRFDLWPIETDPPAVFESSAWSPVNMARCCINRHNGAVNVLFMDWSSRKVGLKELWTLKWHRTFNTDGPWTRSGGVQPSDWPQWMRNFRDY